MRLILTVTLALLSSVAGAQYKGKVFVDNNRNKTAEAQEKGMPGVAVSDGQHVVRTDQDGNFNLPGHAKTRFIFVTVPAGYKLADKHYIRTEEKLKAYNFGLLPDPASAGTSVKMLQITDTETDKYNDWISNLRNFSKKQDISFIVHTGDICYEKGLNFHASQVTAETLGKQVFYCIGNHDLVKGAYGEELFENLFGPVYYSFDAGPAHFIVTPMRSGDFQPSYTVDEVIRWMKNDLAATDRNKPVIIFNHDLLTYSDQFVLKGEKDSINLNENNLKAWVYGHWHNNFVRKSDKTGIQYISSASPGMGGIDNSAGQFLSIEIDKHGVKEIKPHYTYLHKHLVVNTPSGRDMVVIKDGALQINANIYDSETTVKSAKSIIYDEKGNQVAAASLAANTDWNWSGQVPVTKLSKGKSLTIQTEVTFNDGQQHIQKQEFVLPLNPAPLKSKESNSTHLSLNWTNNVKGSVWKANPLVADGKVFTATIDDANNLLCGVTALDAKTGKIAWHYKTRNSVKHAISYDGGTILCTDMEGFTYALKASTGTLIWKKDLGMKSLPGYVSGGIAEKGIYYTGSGAYFQALEVATGKTLWINKEWKGGEGTPEKMTIAGEVIITGSNWQSLFGHDRKTGKLLWERKDDGLRFRSSTGVYQNGKLYITGLNTLLIIDPLTGKNIDKVEAAYEFKVMATPLITDKYVVMPTAKNGVVAYDLKTLKEVWNRPTGNALVYSAPYTGPESGTVESTVVKHGNQLLFGASDGYFYMVNEDSGMVLQKLNLGAPVFADPVVVGNEVFVADFAGNVYTVKIN
ncbi:outer membrane protein assembly factor BamB family protein [Pedobacter caeni]|uniref:Outer membrane protein assembly factor BamB, contains PQQ-like beta-propeller repeat n=1 Tax=Pedobacter caeni TaxID=288992 RepID=A0A1M5HT31_9SPHI|nr:PQQ-binding-like beta-propeller repeat protein [Pedobacter caeni]SHG19097.1 Outer membrane protein assembly factor BamB, contains PQQ-like beta-propeller repeat [Pedobacter caeni]